jgi:hypothetical protein
VPALVQANWLQFLVLPHVVGSSREPSGVKEARWVCAPGWTYELITIRAALPDPGALQQREQRLDGRDHAPRGRRLACLLVYPPLDRPDAQIDLAPAQALDLRAPAHGVAGECIGERVLDLERREQLERRRCPRRALRGGCAGRIGHAAGAGTRVAREPAAKQPGADGAAACGGSIDQDCLRAQAPSGLRRQGLYRRGERHPHTTSCE